MDDFSVEFVELVAHYANQCRTASKKFSSTFAGNLNDITAMISCLHEQLFRHHLHLDRQCILI